MVSNGGAKPINEWTFKTKVLCNSVQNTDKICRKILILKEREKFCEKKALWRTFKTKVLQFLCTSVRNTDFYTTIEYARKFGN